MTKEQIRDLVKECGLDWHRGFMPLFEGDETNRYAVLIAEAMRIEREACLAAVRGVMLTDHAYNTWKRCVKAIKLRGGKE